METTPNPHIWEKVGKATWVRSNQQGYTIRLNKEKGLFEITFSPETFTFDLSIPNEPLTFANNLLEAIKDFQERVVK